MVILVHKKQRIPRWNGAWIYLDEDFVEMQRWEGALGGSRRISFAEQIGPISETLRHPFIEWTSSLGRKAGFTMEWWMTPLAGRNVGETPIFLHLCYLQIIADRWERTSGPLLIVCEDWDLLKTIELLARTKGVRSRRTIGWRARACVDLGRGFGVFLVRWLRELGSLLVRLTAARITRRLAPRTAGERPMPVVVLHTCVDQAGLGADGRFGDRYFGPLADWLRNRSYRVIVVPWIFNPQRSLYSIIRWFRTSTQEFLLLEDFMRISDVPGGMWRVRQTGRVLQGAQEFSGFDVTPLVERERRNNAGASVRLKFFLYGPALRRWVKAGNSCATFIDMFENMHTERIQIQTLRTALPSTRIVGYQHSIIPNEFTGYSVTPDELRSGVFPDAIVTTGPFNTGYLVRCGWPRELLRTGPALRFDYLFHRAIGSASSQISATTSKVVLAVLPLDLAAACETVVRLAKAAPLLAERRIELRLKPHPMMSKAVLLDTAGVPTLLANWTWADESMAASLGQADVVVGIGTSALFDAAVSGVPIVCLGRELGFAYNPMGLWAERHPSCTTVQADNMIEKLDAALERTGIYSPGRLSALSEDLLSGLGRVDAPHMEEFIRAAP